MASSVRRQAGRLSRARVLTLSDSQVNVRAWTKGRSSSRRLNAVLQRSSVDQLWAGLYVGMLHVPTEANALDDPTRGRKVRARSGPVVGAEQWRKEWAALEDGPPHVWFA